MQIESQEMEESGRWAVEIESDSLKTLLLLSQGELLDGCIHVDALSDYMHVHLHPFALSRSAKETML